jgi:hypothetical protein
VVEWDVEVIWRPFFIPKWDVSASKPDEGPAEWKEFFRSAVNLTMPVTLPKGSPDDNPVETIFSDIQLMVLDNSNDPDVKTTQRRISRHLRRCNRRQNRCIHIPYLHGFHKD